MRRWLRRRRAETVIVHTLDEKSIQGMLSEVGPDGLLLAAPVLLHEDAAVPLVGELWVPEENIRFVQLNVGETS